MPDVVTLDADDPRRLHGGVGQADGYQVAQADDLMLMPGYPLQVLDVRLHRAGWLLNCLQMLPGLLQQLRRIFHIIEWRRRSVPAVFGHGCGILDPALPFRLVHWVALCHRPLDLRKGEVCLQISGAGGSAHAIQAGDGRVVFDDGHIGSVLAAFEDPAPEHSHILLQLDHALGDLAVFECVGGEDLPLVQGLVGLQHRPDAGEVCPGLFQTVRPFADDLPGLRCVRS